MPLAWDEVTARLDPRRFTIRTFEKRIASGDQWADFKKHGQKLPI
jgi:DNA primase